MDLLNAFICLHIKSLLLFNASQQRQKYGIIPFLSLLPISVYSPSGGKEKKEKVILQQSTSKQAAQNITETKLIEWPVN